jgi:ribulose 1,5-bisphosphate carboxylase large subunit-like protein
VPDETPQVVLDLSLHEAQELHAVLEKLLESGQSTEALQRTYRLLGWRTLAAKGGTGLTARISELAREAETLEEYEAARDQFLGPILDGLERGENRDP